MTKVIVTKQSLQQMLDEADDSKRQHIVGRALVALFQRQTESEKATHSTKVDNGIGFCGSDAATGTLTAKSYIRNQRLLDWQVEQWTRKSPKTGFSRICKYHKQLNEVAIQKRGYQ